MVIAVHLLDLPDDRRFIGGDVKVVGKGRAFFGRRGRWNRSVGQFFMSGELADVVWVDKGNGEKKRITSFLFKEPDGIVREVGVF